MSILTHHIYLIAPGASPAEIRRFYGAGLGLEEIAKPASLTDIPVIWFAAGTVAFHIGLPDQGAVGDGHTALAVTDVDGMRAHLSALGYAIDDNAIPMGYPRFYTRDPWGNQFEILPREIPAR